MENVKTTLMKIYSFPRLRSKSFFIIIYRYTMFCFIDFVVCLLFILLFFYQFFSVNYFILCSNQIFIDSVEGILCTF